MSKFTAALAAAMMFVVPGKLLTIPGAAGADSVVVSPAGPVRSISQGLALLKPGGTLLLEIGVGQMLWAQVKSVALME